MIKIKTTKTVDSYGNKKRLIEDIEILGKYELPEKYLEGDCVYLNTFGKNVIYLKSGVQNYLLEEGKSYMECEFQKIRNTLEECGGRLQKINQRLKALRESWNGEETFEI